MTSASLSIAFRQDSLTTASKSTLEQMAKTLGFTQNQTVLFALARLRDQLGEQPAKTSAPLVGYSPLKEDDLAIIRQHAPKRRSKPVRSANIADLI